MFLSAALGQLLLPRQQLQANWWEQHSARLKLKTQQQVYHNAKCHSAGGGMKRQALRDSLSAALCPLQLGVKPRWWSSAQEMHMAH